MFGSAACTFVDIVTCELFNVIVTVNNSLVQSVICLKTDLLQIFPPLFKKKIILSVAENNLLHGCWFSLCLFLHIRIKKSSGLRTVNKQKQFNSL